MKTFKRLLKIVIFFGLLLVLFLLYSTLTDYKPKTVELIYESENADTIYLAKPIRFMIWNIGYCGLSSDMDFFYDGGTQVRTSRSNFQENFNFVKTKLKNSDSLDFILLQEVDWYSRRSYYVNELDSFAKILHPYKYFFGKNYDVKFVPSPITKPLGRVKSGLVSFSKYTPKAVCRYSFPGNFSWPVRLFMLDRCFLVKRFPVNNGKELIVINTHNSAYDDGSLKKQQMEYLKDFIVNEYSQGNYIIVGGDWNQNPPDIDYSEIRKNSSAKRFVLNPIDSTYLPDNWTWVYDKTSPTNRYLNAPYVKGKTITPIIDFYLMSPNIKSNWVKTQDYNFLHTDHQSVICEILLK